VALGILGKRLAAWRLLGGGAAYNESPIWWRRWELGALLGERRGRGRSSADFDVRNGFSTYHTITTYANLIVRVLAIGIKYFTIWQGYF
jgi:hypothetical protein